MLFVQDPENYETIEPKLNRRTGVVARLLAALILLAVCVFAIAVPFKKNGHDNDDVLLRSAMIHPKSAAVVIPSYPVIVTVRLFILNDNTRCDKFRTLPDSAVDFVQLAADTEQAARTLNSTFFGPIDWTFGRMEIKLTKMQHLCDKTDWAMDPSTRLNELKVWLQNQAGMPPDGSPKSMYEYDVTLFVGENVNWDGGIAASGSICSPAWRSVAVSMTMVQWVFAHEIGHVLGLPHGSCSDLMHVGAQGGSFGSCSIQTMNNLWTSGSLSCLENRPIVSYPPTVIPTTSPTPEFTPPPTISPTPDPNSVCVKIGTFQDNTFRQNGLLNGAMSWKGIPAWDNRKVFWDNTQWICIDMRCLDSPQPTVPSACVSWEPMNIFGSTRTIKVLSGSCVAPQPTKLPTNFPTARPTVSENLGYELTGYNSGNVNSPICPSHLRVGSVYYGSSGVNCRGMGGVNGEFCRMDLCKREISVKRGFLLAPNGVAATCGSRSIAFPNWVTLDSNGASAVCTAASGYIYNIYCSFDSCENGSYFIAGVNGCTASHPLKFPGYWRTLGSDCANMSGVFEQGKSLTEFGMCLLHFCVV